MILYVDVVRLNLLLINSGKGKVSNLWCSLSGGKNACKVEKIIIGCSCEPGGSRGSSPGLLLVKPALRVGSTCATSVLGTVAHQVRMLAGEDWCCTHTVTLDGDPYQLTTGTPHWLQSLWHLKISTDIYFFYLNFQVSFSVRYEMNQSEAQIQTDVSCIAI